MPPILGAHYWTTGCRKPAPRYIISAVNNKNPFRKLRQLFIRALLASAQPLPEERGAIWSIPQAFQTVYFLIFIGITIPIIADIAQEQIAARLGASWIQLARATATAFAPAGVGAAIGSLIAVQGVALIVSLYHFITNRFTIPAIQAHEARGREEGIIQGAEQANRAWSEWNQRRLTHEAQGTPFLEPPPDHQPPPNGRQP